MNPNIKKKYVSNKISNYYNNKKNKMIEKDFKDSHMIEYKNGGFSKVFQCIIERIYMAFTRYKIPKNTSYIKILNCSKKELEDYLFNKLHNGMTFENHGEWEVDHIIPIDSFNFDNQHNINQENLLKCFGYNNLQPLWRNENRQKSNNIDYIPHH